MKALEKAARALCGYEFDHTGNDPFNRRQEVIDRRWERYVGQARAVIASIEVDGAMMDAAWKEYLLTSPANGMRAALKAALHSILVDGEGR